MQQPAHIKGGLASCAIEHSGFSPDKLYFQTVFNKLRIVQAAAQNTFQIIPQYVEVPPNSEAKRLISYFSAVLSY